MLSRLLLVLVLFALPGYGASDQWPHWRGPAANGVAAAGDYPRAWTHESTPGNLRWRAALPGRGSSTPVIWGDHIFVTCPVDGQNGVLCFDWNGRLRWTVKITEVLSGRHNKGSGTNPSPVTDGKRVYVYFKSGDLACLDFNGTILWQHNLQRLYGADQLKWDLGTSPVLTEKDVVIACMQAGPSYLAAFDKATGVLHWKTDRVIEAPQESKDSYTTPVVYTYQGHPRILSLGADHVTAHDAETGREIWRVGGLNPGGAGNWRSIAGPVVVGNTAVIPYGRGNTLTGIRLGGQGDVSGDNKIWERQGAFSDVPTPAGRDGRAYVCSDRGDITCLDAVTGKTIWAQSLPRGGGKISASPVLAGSWLYITREDGVTHALELNAAGYDIRANNTMGERVIASPVLCRASVFIRTVSALYCIQQAND